MKFTFSLCKTKQAILRAHDVANDNLAYNNGRRKYKKRRKTADDHVVGIFTLRTSADVLAE